tara:strand:- start:411 stop:641 length:231 start_codon:yes stop_codon:yes gene_type:complete
MEKTKVSLKRHVVKTITWRVIGTIDTMLLGWFVSGDPIIGLTIGTFEVVTKMVLYFLHERAWYRYDFGVERNKKIK